MGSEQLGANCRLLPSGRGGVTLAEGSIPDFFNADDVDPNLSIPAFVGHTTKIFWRFSEQRSIPQKQMARNRPQAARARAQIW
jgi:hypothetical protein